MRNVAMAGLAVLLAACGTGPVGMTPASVTIVEPALRAPRPSREEQLAAFWAERRKPSAGTFAVTSDWAPQNFPRSVDSQDQSDLDSERLARESAATRDAVRAALRR